MNRASVTADVFRLVLDGRATDALDLVTDHAGSGDDPWFLVLASFAAFMRSDYETSARLADDALAGGGDDTARVGALAARGLAAAGWWPGAATTWTDAAPTTTASGDPLTEAFEQLGTLDASPAADAVRYLVAEAALACGRLNLAASVVDASGPVPAWPGDHPFGDLVRVHRARLLVFLGRIDDAEAIVRDLATGRRAPLLELLVASANSLVRGNAADRGAARRLADRVEAGDLAAPGYLSSGCRLLAAFGLTAVGDVRRSARLVLEAGGDERLSALTIVDRALGLELLVALAAADADIDAAEAWADQAVHLRGHPIAGSTIARLDSRVALLAGRPREAVELADLAVGLATAEGRAVEAAEGEIVGSRARLSASEAGVATARLEAAVALAESTGFRAVRMSAARELRRSGRRLRPVAGVGWPGLSARERDVALLVAQGASNAGIARALHLSDHTVRAHVSRVLAAFGAASRLAVGEALADRVPDDGVDVSLTPRQRAVADALARGLGNAAIARELGISVKTVEKHLADIRSRWQVSTRGEVARLARAATRGE
ncbi:LuxR C-terminal-related transcriptional regulator [Pseudolysinimonas sp.]|uniref:LuxR C-terminal-related transcriptional regulator n=1 Tax=Pseudolysinimonas sp. TaxID=2680009 RepID=UPI0037837F71